MTNNSKILDIEIEIELCNILIKRFEDAIASLKSLNEIDSSYNYLTTGRELQTDLQETKMKLVSLLIERNETVHQVSASPLLSRIKRLSEDKNVTFAQIERECELSNGSMRKWSTSIPAADKLQKVANYFNVSLDYLMGNTTKPESDIIDLSEIFSNNNNVLFNGRELTKEEISSISFELDFNDPKNAHLIAELANTVVSGSENHLSFTESMKQIGKRQIDFSGKDINNTENKED